MRTPDIALELDDRTRAAIARLTDNERECLRRRLLPQTAKEMAIELGVSPHAVEKRLKMARAKLGVSSSLAAARLLAGSEGGYQQPVPQPSDLAIGARRVETAPRAGTTRRTMTILGVLSMILAAAALALGLPHPQTSHAVDKAALDHASAFLGETFKSLDRDHSGFLDPREASALEPHGASRDHALPAPSAGGARDAAAENKWMGKLDSDGDGRVSRDEYVGYMMPWILLHGGVPANWKPRS
jgi:DNA-binding CsgD family transcriptional regulator